MIKNVLALTFVCGQSQGTLLSESLKKLSCNKIFFLNCFESKKKYHITFLADLLQKNNLSTLINNLEDTFWKSESFCCMRVAFKSMPTLTKKV